MKSCEIYAVSHNADVSYTFLTFCVIVDSHFFVALQDNVVYDRLAKNQAHGDVTLQHLEEFATIGTAPPVTHLNNMFDSFYFF